MALLFYVLGMIGCFVFLSASDLDKTDEKTNDFISISISWPFYVIGMVWIYRHELAYVLSHFMGFHAKIETEDNPYEAPVDFSVVRGE
jgi:hypothetical protein